jgi:protein subunit release factor B
VPMHYATDHTSLEKDSRVEFFRASGPGGQHRNKTSTAVRLYHKPSGIIIEAKDSRSQDENRTHAFKRLQRRLQRLNNPPAPRTPTKVPRSQKKQRLSDKRMQSVRKEERKQPSLQDE